MRREGGLRGGSIAEPQAFEAGCSPQAIAKDRRFPDVVIHLFEVRRLLLARAQERHRTRHHRHVAVAEHCRHREPEGFAYYAAPYSWQTPKSGRPKPPFSRTASIESGAILSPKGDRAVQNVVSLMEGNTLALIFPLAHLQLFQPDFSRGFFYVEPERGARGGGSAQQRPLACIVCVRRSSIKGSRYGLGLPGGGTQGALRL
jgi:hypothetical protein